MKFNVFSEMDYYVRGGSTIIFNIHALRTPGQSVLAETFTLDPYLKSEEFTSGQYENRFVRIEVAEDMNLKVSYKALVDTNFKLIPRETLENSSVPILTGDVLPYLFPSRYCQSDKLSKLARDKFGHYPSVCEKVMKITEWIHKNVDYYSGSTNSQTSAFDTVTERSGVCRDFAHLGIALCRALSIPARYFTGYAYNLVPQDFHACFEAYIGGYWIVFDATKLAPLNGFVKIAKGRDAADAAISTNFGTLYCNSIQASCELADENFTPFWYIDPGFEGIAYS